MSDVPSARLEVSGLPVSRAVDGAARGPRGAERHVTAPLLLASPPAKSARTSSPTEPICRGLQVQRRQYVRSFRQAHRTLGSSRRGSAARAVQLIDEVPRGLRYDSGRSPRSKAFQKG